MGKIMGKEMNDYIKVIKLPLIIWVVWALIGFVVSIVFANEITALTTGGAAALAVGMGIVAILAIMSLVGLVIDLALGIWVGWRTVTAIHGSYLHAAVAAFLLSVIGVAVSLVLNVAIEIIMGRFLAAILTVLITVALGFVFSALIHIVLALIGVFAAGMMGKK